MATLEELYKTNAPEASKANLKGKDKTPLEPDGGLDLATNEAAIKKAWGGDLGTNAGGHKPTSPYSDNFK